MWSANAGNWLPKALCFTAVRVFVCPYVCLCIHVWLYTISFVNVISYKLLVEISPYLQLRCTQGRDELFQFWGQKVKGEVHSDTKYGQESLVQKCIFVAKAYWLMAPWWPSSLYVELLRVMLNLLLVCYHDERHCWVVVEEVCRVGIIIIHFCA